MKNPLRPSLGEKVCYGFGDLASVLYWQTFMLYLTFFYTDVAMLPLGAAATMILVVRTWDWINDPIMGIIADRTHTRWGKFRPYLLWLCVPFAIAGVLTFTAPDLSPGGRLIWAYVTYALIMMLYTAINIPYTALLGVISPESDDRTTVSSIKFLFAFAAGIIVSATLLPMVSWLGGDNEALGWQLSFVIFGVGAVVFFLIAFAGTRERVQPPKTQKMSILKDLKELVTNGPWLILLLATLTFILYIALRGSVTVHYFKYIVGDQEASLPFLGTQSYGYVGWASAFNTVGQVSAFIGVLVVAWFSRIVGKKMAFVVLLAIGIVSTGAYYFLSADQMLLIFFFQVTGSMSGGPLSVLLWAMYADTADYAEWKNGRRATGLVFSASTMSQKIGWAFGAFFALKLMEKVGFEANVDQTVEATDGLLMLFSIIPAFIGIVAIVIIMFYPLGEKRVAKMEAELKSRRRSEDDEVADGATP